MQKSRHNLIPLLPFFAKQIIEMKGNSNEMKGNSNQEVE